MGVLVSEWIKLRSLRSTWILAAAVVVTTTAVSLLGISGLAAGWSAQLPADYDPLGIGFKGILVGQILVGVLGAQAMTAEYATGQIVSTLAIVPRRGRLLAAKGAVTGMLGAATAVATALCSFAASQAALAAAGLPTASPSDPATLRAILCAAAYLVLAALLGLAFGTITRSGTGALGVVVTAGLLIPALAPGLPGAVGAFAATYWPLTAGQASYTAAGAASPVPGIAIMAVFTVWTIVAAHLVLTRRDA